MEKPYRKQEIMYELLFQQKLNARNSLMTFIF